MYTWHSGPVVKRVGPRQVVTQSGTIYHLCGPSDQEGFIRSGIGHLAPLFDDGFPENWRSHFQLSQWYVAVCGYVYSLNALCL